MKSVLRFALSVIIFCLMAIIVSCKSKTNDFNTAITEPISAEHAVFSNGIFHITSGGRYVFTGEYEGQILIETANDDIVELALDGLTLHNPDGSAIFAVDSGRVELVLTEGTINTISAETNAAIFIHDELIISGDGTLNIINKHHNGINTNGLITINSGVFIIETVGHSIQAEAVTINGGSLTITAEGKAITATGSIFITGGNLQIVNSDEGIEGFNVTITGGDINIFSNDDGINARDSEEPTGGTRGRLTPETAKNQQAAQEGVSE